MDYEATDKAALLEAKLNLRVCPNCGGHLFDVAYLEGVRGCDECCETWHRERWEDQE